MTGLMTLPNLDTHIGESTFPLLLIVCRSCSCYVPVAVVWSILGVVFVSGSCVIVLYAISVRYSSTGAFMMCVLFLVIVLFLWFTNWYSRPVRPSALMIVPGVHFHYDFGTLLYPPTCNGLCSLLIFLSW